MEQPSTVDDDCPVWPVFRTRDPPSVKERYLTPFKPAEALQEPERVDRLSVLPTEILQMILYDVTPVGLLFLSRVSRRFRELVWTKRAKGVWRTARYKAALLSLSTGDLSEVQCARIIACDQCQVCREYLNSGWEMHDMVTFRLRKVICRACRRGGMLLTLAALRKDFPYLHPETYSCIQSVDHEPSTLQRYYVPHALEHSARLCEVEAQAIAECQPPGLATAAYINEQQDRLDYELHDSRLLLMWSIAREQDLKRVAKRLRGIQRDFCVRALMRLGYRPDDLTPLREVTGIASWLCWCAKENMQEEAWEERLQEEMRDWREEDSDEESLREEILAKHAACIKVPKEFWRYWLVDEGSTYDESDDWPTTDKEWTLLQHVYIELAERNKLQRLARELPAARQENLWPFYDKLKRTEPAASLIAFDQFCTELPAVKRLWWPPDAQMDRETWLAVQPDIVRELAEKVRGDKICLFKRILRTLNDDGYGDLPTWVAPFLEDDAKLDYASAGKSDSARAFEPDLTDADMDSIFRRVSALFRCGYCSDKLIYPDIARHLVDVHQASSITAYAFVPNSEFRLAVEEMLNRLNHPANTPADALQELTFDVTERRTKTVLGLTSREEPWDQVVAGRRRSAGRNPYGAGLAGAETETDRRIIEIWPCGPSPKLRSGVGTALDP